MALPPEPSITTFHIVATAVPTVALIITIFRLVHRHRRNLSWWDDALIGIASFFMILLVIGVWLLTAYKGLSQTVKVSSYYLCTYTFSISIYSARLCILFGIMRIAPTPPSRKAIRYIAAFFLVILSVLLAQKIWVCDGGDKSWKKEPSPSCHLGLQVAVTELVTDIVCDSILVILPIIFLWGSRLRAGQKRRVYAIFSASCITTIVSIVQDWLILAAGGLREETASMIEVSVSIIVANLPFIVSICYRFFRKQESNNSNNIGGTSSDGRGRTIYSRTASGERPRHLIRLSDRTAKPQPAVLRGSPLDPLASWKSEQSRGSELELDTDTFDAVDKYSPERKLPHDHLPFTLQNPAERSSSDLNLTRPEGDPESPSLYSLNTPTTLRDGSRNEGLVRVEIVSGADDDEDERLFHRPLSQSRMPLANLSAGVRIDQEVVISTDPLPTSPMERHQLRFAEHSS